MPAMTAPARRRRRGAGDRRRGPAAHCRQTPRSWVTTIGARGSRRWAPHRRSWCSGCGWTGQCRPDRAPFIGTGGRPPLDNVSVLDRYERQAADWSAAVGGSVVELHAYAVTAPDDGLRERLLGRLHELYPETAGANIIGERVLRRNDCPRFAPGDFAARPTVDHAHAGLALAGDGIRVDLPVALMERAATTGWSAANRLLAAIRRCGSRPTNGSDQRPLGALRRLANRERQLRHDHPGRSQSAIDQNSAVSTGSPR